MRETRLSGSEGGAGHISAPSLPLSSDAFRQEGGSAWAGWRRGGVRTWDVMPPNSAVDAM